MSFAKLETDKAKIYHSTLKVMVVILFIISYTLFNIAMYILHIISINYIISIIIESYTKICMYTVYKD